MPKLDDIFKVKAMKNLQDKRKVGRPKKEPVNMDIMPIGKLKGKNISEVLKCLQYCYWLMNTGWFELEYPHLAGIIKEHLKRNPAPIAPSKNITTLPKTTYPTHIVPLTKITDTFIAPMYRYESKCVPGMFIDFFISPN